MSTERTSSGLFHIVLIALAVLVLFPMLLMVFAVPMVEMMGWWWGGGMVGGFSPLWGVGTMLVWLVVLIPHRRRLPPLFDSIRPSDTLFGEEVSAERGEP